MKQSGELSKFQHVAGHAGKGGGDWSKEEEDDEDDDDDEEEDSLRVEWAGATGHAREHVKTRRNFIVADGRCDILFAVDDKIGRKSRMY